MPKPRKKLINKSIIEPLTNQELSLLKSEIDLELKYRKRAELRKVATKNIKKTRDKLKIGQTITYKKSAAGKAVESAEVTAIFRDKVQVILDGRKRSILLQRIVNE